MLGTKVERKCRTISLDNAHDLAFHGGEQGVPAVSEVLHQILGNKLETFAGETYEWKGWSFKMRQCISVVDEELYVELVDVEANPLRELPLAGMNKPQKKRARQLAFMLMMHTKDRALQMIT